MIWAYSAILLLVAADRWTKYLAQQGVQGQFGFAKFLLTKNDALVFSWPAPNAVAIALVFCAIGFVVILAFRHVRLHRHVVISAYALILIGALSNLVDRLFFGYVIDWAYFGRWWPVFNIADLCICAGVVVLVLSPRLTGRKN